jgi:predicted ATPase/class 3 adenylate cyclase
MPSHHALLLTDVVDSTGLAEQLGDAALAELWAQHDRAARDLLPRWRGREIDKSDGMLLLFEHTNDAAQYALAYHAALAALPLPLRARAGLHWGPALLRENSAADVARGAKPLEVDGLAKPVAARVMGLALGGQTLISAEAQAELRGHVQADAFMSHGHWQFKGVSEPLEVFELVPAGTEFRLPPGSDKAWRVARVGERWLPVVEVPNNLPQQASAFIGRERELREVKAALSQARLVTLLGMGGLGKTRLSVQVAAETLHLYPDGVWFLDLAPIREAALVAAEAANVLGVRQEPERTLLQSLCAQVRERRLLFVVDNCEHLVQACADLAHALLKAAPEVRLIASSREALRVPGEQTYAVLPLPVPSASSSLQALRGSTAVRLFVERARSHKPGFELTDAVAPAVAELVGRLEGIPLALELAAARVRSLSVADINRRLGDRFKVLTGGSRSLQQRQQTLRDLVDWSYELLSEDERTLLRRLGCFRGDFNLQSLEAICAAEPLDEFALLDLSQQLVEKSLLMSTEEEGQTRLRMLDTVREYALDKLVAAGEASAVQRAHGLYYFELAKQARNGLRGAEQGHWLALLEAERDNMRAAIALAQQGVSTLDPVITVKMAVALQAYWILRGHASEGREVVRQALTLPQVLASDVAHAHGLYVGAALAWSQSDHAGALRDLKACLALRRQLGNAEDIAATLSTQAVALLSHGDPDSARLAAEEALALFRQCGYAVGEVTVLLQLGQIALELEDDAVATQCLEQALAGARRIQNQENEAEAELTLAQQAFMRGDQAQAEARLQASLGICEATGDRRGACNARAWLARLAVQRGELHAARAALSAVLPELQQLELREQLLGCLEDHVWLAVLEDRSDEAVALVALIEHLRENAGLPRSPRHQRRWDALWSHLDVALKDATLDSITWHPGEWDTAEAMRLARAITQT